MSSKTLKEKDRKRGRADADDGARLTILDAAEDRFAVKGYYGTTVRAIGDAGNINPALIHYHFGSKEELFRQVIARRAEEINERRKENLLTIFADSSPNLPSLEDVLDAFLRPLIELGRDEERGGRRFTMILYSLVAANDPLAKNLISENFDEIADRSITSIIRVVPELSRPVAVQCYLAAIQTAFNQMAPTGRSSGLAGGQTYPRNTAEAIDFAIRFSAAGIRRIAST